jgi:O-antigen/teichoic acid export membrane protein
LDDVIKLFRHVAVYGLGQIIGKLVAFLLIPLFTHYLSKADFGIMEILNQTSTLLGIALGLGVANAVTRFYYSTENQYDRKVIVSTGMFFGVAAGTFVLVSCWLKAPLFAKLLLGAGDQTGATLIRLAATTLFFTFCADIGWTYLQTTQRSMLYVVVSQAFLLSSVAFNIYLVVIRKMAVVGVFWSSVLASGAVAILLLSVTIRNVGMHFSTATLRKLLLFGAPLTPAWVGAFVMNFSDRFVLQHFRGLQEVGVYSVGYKFGFIVSLLVVQPFIMIWEPKAYEIAAKQNAHQVFPKIFTVYSTLLIFLGLVISVPIREVFELMIDRKFFVAYELVPVVAFAYVAQGVGRFNEAALLIRNKTHMLAAIGVLSAAACIVANLIFIGLWGMWGGAISTFVTFMLFALASFFYAQRHYHISHDIKTFRRVCIAAGIVLVTAFLIPGGWSLWLRIPAKLLLLCVFVIALWKMGVIGSEELHEIRRRIGYGWRKRAVATNL